MELMEGFCYKSKNYSILLTVQERIKMPLKRKGFTTLGNTFVKYDTTALTPDVWDINALMSFTNCMEGTLPMGWDCSIRYCRKL